MGTSNTLPISRIIYSYSDIQRAWDKELQLNDQWSVFLLPKGIHYFNGYVPHQLSPYLSEDEILQYLVNYTFVFNNDDSDASLGVRLMLQHRYFQSIPHLWQFSQLVHRAMAESDEIGFKANAIAISIINPYYKFNTYDKHERASVRRRHRNELKLKNTISKNINKLHEILEDYDLANGLLTKEYLQTETNLSRYKLNQILNNDEDTNEMFKLIRSASITSTYYKK